MKQTISKSLRIIWTITVKDLTDAIKNKNIISLLLSALFIVVVYKFLPGIMADERPQRILIYPPGNSIIIGDLQDDPTIELEIFDDEKLMQYELTNGDVPELGIVIPKETEIKEGKLVDIKGYALKVHKTSMILQLKGLMEEKLEKILGQPVQITIEEIPFQPDTYGMTVLTSMGFVFVTLIVGMMVIPHIMIEEKQQKTLDSIRVSPAKEIHIVLAKALTGLIYSIGVIFIALVFNLRLVQHNWLFFLGGLIGSIFGISLGLLLGIVIETRQQLTLYSWIAIIPLFIPMILSLMDDILPTNWVKIFTWVPSTLMFRVFRTSMSGIAPVDYFLPQLSALLLFAVLFIYFDSRLIQRLDR